MMDKLTTHWTEYAKQNLEGKTITTVRYLHSEEVEALGWHHSALVIQLSDGTLLFPSADDEGNDAGALFGQKADGSELTFPVV